MRIGLQGHVLEELSLASPGTAVTRVVKYCEISNLPLHEVLRRITIRSRRYG